MTTSIRTRGARAVALAGATAVAAITVLTAGGNPAVAIAAPPAYYPYGPQTNVDESDLDGWMLCWTGTYDGAAPIADILAACPGDYLLLAGGPAASTVYDVVAAAERTDVLTDTGAGDTTTVHTANGSGWYFSPDWSWGFAKEGQAVNKYSCDVADSSWVGPPDLVGGAYRLCWHTGGGEVFWGWRSGNNIELFSSDFRRSVYVPDPNVAPDCSGAAASVTSIWSPDHRWVPVDVLGVTDADGDAITITIDSIFQDESTTAKGSGNTPIDGAGVATSTAQVRAERVGKGDGRVYHIAFTADDGNGGSCSGTVLVGVPHDQGGQSTAIDGGALFDSTV